MNSINVGSPFTDNKYSLKTYIGAVSQSTCNMKPLAENMKILYFAKKFEEPYVQIITVGGAKRRHSVCSCEGEESEDPLPELHDKSHVLDEHHLAALANQIPPRTQGYPWRLVYSTAEHGTSLKSLYRKMAQLDRPVLLVIKDMENQVFGAFSSHPFRVSDCCYGTGETFLYSFSPELKMFRWSGENSYFVKGFLDSLQLGAGGGHFGLWLDADLYRGSSYSCNTFHNQPLSLHHDFTVKELEVWTFQ
ncbi:nuclear receptor coactivator 7 isoform X2 [Chanos chanos]|uniref:Nuclear receptor coactivator 7 isoform X2 n=1 Tax=Chanos chanos TaxID=29144 RepID=A0A6J2W489_CHACN|nr:nuclear receptor coactivator 7-like isoform X2 [Chanos chanos]